MHKRILIHTLKKNNHKPVHNIIMIMSKWIKDHDNALTKTNPKQSIITNIQPQNHAIIFTLQETGEPVSVIVEDKHLSEKLPGYARLSHD